jgi:hypothetical protein
MRFLTIALSFFFAALMPDGQGVAEAQPLSKWEDQRSSLSLQGSYGITGSGLFASSWGVRMQTREPGWPATFRFGLNVQPGSYFGQFNIGAISGFEWKHGLVPYIGGGLALSSGDLHSDSPSNAGMLDVGVNVVGGIKADLGTIDPYVEMQGIAGGDFQSASLTAGISATIPQDPFSGGSEYDRKLSELPNLPQRKPTENLYGADTRRVTPIYVHLQNHPSIIEGKDDSAAKKKVGECQKAIYQNAIALAQQGVTAVVAEALPHRGTSRSPEPLPTEVFAKPEGPYDASYALYRTEGVDLYGFEEYDLNDAATYFVRERDAIQRGKSKGTRADLRQMETSFEITTPIRSFEALLVAYRAAVESESDGAQIIIGGGHWADLRRLLVGKSDPFLIRLVRYDYKECQ